MSTYRYYSTPVKMLESIESDNLINMIHSSRMTYGTPESWLAMNDFDDYLESNEEIVAYGQTGVSMLEIDKSFIPNELLGGLLSDRLHAEDSPYYNSATLYSVVYDQLVAEKSPLHLDYGYQLVDYETEANIYPVVLNNKYKKYFNIGDRLAGKIASWQENEDGTNFNNQLRLDDITLEIAGFVKQDSQYLILGAGGDYYTADMLLGNVDDNIDMIILRHPKAYFTTGYERSPNFLIETVEEPNAYINVINDLKNQGWASTFSDVIDDTLQVIKEQVTVPMMNFFMILLISVAAVGGVNGLNQIAQKKNFAIYYICGAKWRQCILIDIIRNALIILIPTILASVAAYSSLRFDEFRSVYAVDYLYALLIIIAIYAVSSLWYIIELIRAKPIDYIREFE